MIYRTIGRYEEAVEGPGIVLPHFEAELMVEFVNRERIVLYTSWGESRFALPVQEAYLDQGRIVALIDPDAITLMK